MGPSYHNDSSRLLDSLRLRAESGAVAQTARWQSLLPEAEADRAAAKEQFTTAPADANARTYLDADRKFRDVGTLLAALEDAGGAAQIRERELSTPAVFVAFKQGFAEKVRVLEKLPAAGLRKLGERRLLLTERGIHPSQIEGDPVVVAWRNYLEEIRVSLAAATFGEKYAAARGEGHDPRSFDMMYQDLTSAIPTPPAA